MPAKKLNRTSVLRSRMGKSQLRKGVMGKKKTTTGSKGLNRSAARTNTTPLTASGSATGLTRAVPAKTRVTTIISSSSRQPGSSRTIGRDVTGYSIAVLVTACLSHFRQHVKCLAGTTLPGEVACLINSLLPQATAQFRIAQGLLHARCHVLDRQRIEVSKSIAGDLRQT